MGNCQAVDAAALVIQHPSGRLERLYWQIPASEVMRMNPGHYVSLIIPLPASEDEQGNRDRNTVRFTRVKLLQPTETLTLGHAYRLITSQGSMLFTFFLGRLEEVMKVMRAKKYAKTKRESMKKLLQHEQENLSSGRKSDADNTDQELKQERQSSRTPPANAAAMRSKSWRPSLQSISEAGS
ncbi:cyclin delta-1 family protein [Hibiscus syriacus]|uniref:Cyclin delta-1 family protein n=1 Tax=Hibiscus syriacus TaxID=106335 RepID=A0A6A2ZMG9_HIBSY|nr:cyclin delta-1 family protein [Hibiscus syriacus]